MKRADQLVHKLKKYIEGKSAIDIACGDGDFTLSLSKHTVKVIGVDISLSRLKDLEGKPDNLSFREISASELHKINEDFNLVFCHNGLAHIEGQLEDILKSIKLKLSHNDYLIFASSWMIDKSVITTKLIPLLKSTDINFEVCSMEKYDIIICQL